MNNLPVAMTAEPDCLTLHQAAGLVWEWRKYRNEVFWKSTYGYGAAAMVLTVLPYLLPQIIEKLGLAVLIFPVLAGFVAVFAAYLMIVQYMLYKLADRKFRSLLGQYNTGDIPNIPVNRLFRISIGKVLAGVFLCFGIIGQLGNGIVLASLVRSLAR